MVAWISIILAMGIFNFLASLYYADAGASTLLIANGCIFGLIGIGMGARVRMKIKARHVEQLLDRIRGFESRE